MATRPLSVFLLSFLLAAPALSGRAAAQADGPGRSTLSAPPIALPRSTGPIQVDGVLDEPAWREAVRVLLPFEWFPGDNTPAPVETEVFLAYDEENLFLGFRALDPDPSRIRANLADRDTPFQDDAVGFMVDPFNDERRGFQFRINPLGVQMDAIFSENEGYEDFSWDAIWDSEGRITGEGYVVEVAVPFKSLRFPRSANPQTWGIVLLRDYPREVRHRMRSHPTDRNRACLLCQMNKMTGVQGADPGRNVELTPTLTAVRTDGRPQWPSGSWDAGEPEYEPGVTARWSMTPNLVFNGALNPDFSQVEADVAQLDVNTRFALFYPERRPFFLEGADFFLTPLNVIFTRTVADPEAGAKLTGKEGPHALGFFLTKDRVNTVILPANQGSRTGLLEGEVTGGVFRYRRDVGSGSTVGALVTAREGEGYSNWVYGADLFWRLSPTYVLQAQYLRSSTDYPDAFALLHGHRIEAFDGDALLLEGRHQSRDWFASLTLNRTGDDFRADAGYLPRVDLASYQGTLARTFWGEARDWYSFLHLGLKAGRIEDLDGSLSEQEAELFAGYSGPLQSQVNAYLTFRDEVFVEDPFAQVKEGETFHLVGAGFGSEIRPSGVATLSLSGSVGEAVDYANAREGVLYTLRPQAELKLGRHLNLQLQHAYQRMQYEGAWTYIANLSQLRAVYNLNVRSFVRAVVQFQDVDRQLDEYLYRVNPENQTLFTQLLFSYKVNPQTVLFLGYSDNSLGYLDAERIRTELTPRSRTFFLKLGWAWRP